MHFKQVTDAHQRIKHIIQHTPIVQSQLLNTWLGQDIYFKVECLQTTGAFKLRGALNVLAKLSEQQALPKHIVANSSGNHAQAVAYAARMFSVPVTIFSTKNISNVKSAATKYYGADLKLFNTRTEADIAVLEASQQNDTLWIPPFNHPDIIAGQATVAYEALLQLNNVDAVFAPCGGGGLISGSLIATRAMQARAKVIGAEPLAANDAAESLRQGKIVPLNGPANTLADGAATPSVGEHTFKYLQQLDAFYEVNEAQIAYWTQWLQHLLKLHIEPTSAMAMQAVIDWLREHANQAQNSTMTTKKRLLVIISGGNISSQSMHKIWAKDYLDTPPSLNLSF